MATWLTRSLLFIVAGAVLAYAVTVRNSTVDLQTTGVILLLVGFFDLLLNVGLSMYLRQPPASVDPYRRAADEGERIRRDSARTAIRQPPRAYPELPDNDTYATRPIYRDNPNWH